MKILLIAQLFFVLLLSNCADHINDALNNNPQYLELWETLGKLDSFNGLSFDDAWKLVIDGRKHSEGPLVFDKEEPGFFAGLCEGLNYALSDYQNPLSIELIERIHHITTRATKKIDESDFGSGMGRVAVQLMLTLGNNATKEGVKALQNKLKDDPLRALKPQTESGKYLLTWEEINRETMIKRVQKVIDEYEHSEKTLENITKMSQDLELLHPFRDGNTRTVIIIILQKELRRFGFSPVIFENPNRFDGYTLSQLLEQEVLPGQKTFKNLLKK